MINDKVFNYAVMAIIAYLVLQALLPYLIWAAIGWVVIKAVLAYERRK